MLIQFNSLQAVRNDRREMDLVQRHEDHESETAFVVESVAALGDEARFSGERIERVTVREAIILVEGPNEKHADLP